MKKNQKPQYPQVKQEQTVAKKISSTLYRLFIQQQKLPRIASLSIVAATYFQLFTTINIIILFTVFTRTNSQIYTIIISSLSVMLVLLDMCPRVSRKHYVFYFVSVGQGLVLSGMIFGAKILIDNYFVFGGHCGEFGAYYGRRNYVVGPKLQILAMCEEINFLFVVEIIVEATLIVGKIFHVILYIRAYKQAKQKFDDDERKKRRKDRYNEMMRKKYVFNQKRKV